MSTPLTPGASPTPEAVVLERALGPAGVRTYASSGTPDDAARDLTASLDARGWSRASAPVLLIAATTDGLDEVTGTAGGPAVLVVRQASMPTEVAWPGWDAAALGAGYVGCLRTAQWSLYAAPSRVAELGPALSFPATDAERWPDAVPTASRDELVAEIVFWRTAALARWARRAGEEPERTNKDLLLEIARAKHLLDATQGTLSWRVTEPLRRLQAARLRGRRR